MLACRVARERGIPYLGICLGMHVAVSDFARHVVGLEGANSTEMDPETPYPVIDLLPEQKEVEDLGGTMRLGAQAVEIATGTRAGETYADSVVQERHRHRYEVNNAYRPALVDAGLVVSGTFQEGRLVEIVELADHPWFVASQFHPEFAAADAAGAAVSRLRGRRAGTRARARHRRARDCPLAPGFEHGVCSTHVEAIGCVQRDPGSPSRASSDRGRRSTCSSACIATPGPVQPTLVARAREHLEERVAPPAVP